MVADGDQTTMQQLAGSLAHLLRECHGKQTPSHHPQVCEDHEAVILAEIEATAAGLKVHKAKKNTVKNKQCTSFVWTLGTGAYWIICVKCSWHIASSCQLWTIMNFCSLIVFIIVIIRVINFINSFKMCSKCDKYQ